MRIMDFFCEQAISADLKAKDKKGVIEELLESLLAAKKIKDKGQVVKILLERENLGSTGIGQGIAIPHGKSDQASNVIITFGRSKEGINFEALDGEPVYLVFLLLAPPDSAGVHLKALAKISRLLKDKYFRRALREAKDGQEIIKTIKQEDEY